jgi:hypothetical protein
MTEGARKVKVGDKIEIGQVQNYIDDDRPAEEIWVRVTVIDIADDAAFELEHADGRTSCHPMACKWRFLLN